MKHISENGVVILSLVRFALLAILAIITLKKHSGLLADISITYTLIILLSGFPFPSK